MMSSSQTNLVGLIVRFLKSFDLEFVYIYIWLYFRLTSVETLVRIKCLLLGSKRFDDFLSLLGDKIQLQDWTKFRGQISRSFLRFYCDRYCEQVAWMCGGTWLGRKVCSPPRRSTRSCSMSQHCCHSQTMTNNRWINKGITPQKGATPLVNRNLNNNLKFKIYILFYYFY